MSLLGKLVSYFFSGAANGGTRSAIETNSILIERERERERERDRERERERDRDRDRETEREREGEKLK
jgi:hypothetical protein